MNNKFEYFLNIRFLPTIQLLFAFSAAVTIGCFQFMNFMAKPKFSETGSLLDSGVDLNMENGVAE